MSSGFHKKTKIIASIWPSSTSEEVIVWLYKSGVNVLRINFSHADYEKTLSIVALVNKLNKAWITKLALLGDLKWPEIRLGKYEGIKKYKQGDSFKIYTTKDAVFGPQDQFCDYPTLSEDLELGHIIRIESGIFDVEVVEKWDKYLIVKALNDAELSQTRHVNLPWIDLKLPGLIEQDKENSKFCIDNNFDYLAMSFVRSAAHVQEFRDFLYAYKPDQTIDLISKIENQEGLNNIEDIIDVSDGIMIARWDLGIEVDIATIPLWQKKIVDLCRERWRLVIIATQMIESMMTSPFPTRAEVSDIFNAIMQKVDAVMTSGETAIGQYPVKTIQTMNRIIIWAEQELPYHYKDFSDTYLTHEENKRKSVVKAALDVAETLNIEHIVLFTRSGRLAKIAAGLRPKPNIYAFTQNWKTFTSLALYFGIKSRLCEFDFYQDGLEQSLSSLVKTGDITSQDRIIAIFETKRGKWYHLSLEVIEVWLFFDS